MKRKFLFPVLFVLFILLVSASPRCAALSPNGTIEASVYDYALREAGALQTLPVVSLRLDGQAAEGDVPGVIVDGRTMAPLRLLAEYFGAEVTWDPDDGDAVTVCRDNDEIRLTLGSAEAVVNGEHADLPDGVPAAVIVYEGQGYTMVPLRFFSEALGCRVGWLQERYSAIVDGPDSALYGLHTPVEPENHVIILDAGHGGWASGAYHEGVLEKDLDLAITLKAREMLTRLGYHILMTREEDVYVSLGDRSSFANASNADIFVSIHCNALEPGLKADGVHVYHFPKSKTGAAFAQALQTPICAFTGAKDRGIAQGDFHVLRETVMPAVLVESGYMTDHDELTLLCDDTYQTAIARGIAQGVIDFLNGCPPEKTA